MPQINSVNHHHLRLLFARINDMESKDLFVEQEDELYELYTLAWKLLEYGGSLTKEEIDLHKLEQY